MMFHTLPQYSPVQQDFIWAAEYMDGSHLAEFDFTTHAENSFYSIKRDQIIRFGLVGLGNRFYFEGFGGSFKVAGRAIDFVYEVDGKQYPLSGFGQMYNDIITFKDVETIADVASGKSLSRIIQYSFGYKTKLAYEDMNLNFQALCQIPFNEPARFNVKLVSDKALDGNLIILRNGQVAAKYKAPLEEGLGGELNWIIQ